MKKFYCTLNGKEFTFTFPTINENSLLEFKDGDLTFKDIPFSFSYEIVEREKQMRVKDELGKVWLVLNIDNEQFLQEVKKVKKEMTTDIISFYERVLKDEERIFLFVDVPLPLTSPTLLDKGHLSVKYKSAILHALNKRLEEEGVAHFSVSSIEQLSKLLRNKKEHAKKEVYMNESVYSWSLTEIVHVLQGELVLA